MNGRGRSREKHSGAPLRSILFTVLVGFLGVGVLVSLGTWQLRRLAWKEGLIARIEAVIADAPVPLPAAPDPARDRYRAVTVAGHFTGPQTRILTSLPGHGPGYLLVAGFRADDGRAILLQRGYVPDSAPLVPPPPGGQRVTGNLDWPDDLTPGMAAHDAARDIWVGHDLPGLAAQLGTQPLLVIVREGGREGESAAAGESTGAGAGAEIIPAPVTAALRNDHLGYALTWFGLAAVWAGMTGVWLWRIRAGRA